MSFVFIKWLVIAQSEDWAILLTLVILAFSLTASTCPSLVYMATYVCGYSLFSSWHFHPWFRCWQLRAHISSSCSFPEPVYAPDSWASGTASQLDCLAQWRHLSSPKCSHYCLAPCQSALTLLCLPWSWETSCQPDWSWSCSPCLCALATASPSMQRKLLTRQSCTHCLPRRN